MDKIIGQGLSYKGTVIRLGNKKRLLLNELSDWLIDEEYEEISIPIIQHQEIFQNKVGEENNNLMFNFTDRKDRQLCLVPEVTAVIQQLALKDFKFQNNKKLFYIQECFRGERQQHGRWRQFTQFGVEILNIKGDEFNIENVANLAMALINERDAGCNGLELNYDVVRGLDYYIEGKGFEIRDKDGLQLCGGGEYQTGDTISTGFALGVDRILL